ncbi:MAG: hypothetical protein II697_06125, partial [Clostridia bacterium]|nr:hypothetical protein [Clostridia bacterium]
GVPFGEDLLLLAFFFLFGLMCATLGIGTAIYNKRVRLQLTGDGVEAYFPHYFYGRRICCKYAEIVSVRLESGHGDQTQTLVVHCLDAQKDLEVSGLLNGPEILHGIQSRLSYHKPESGIEDMKNALVEMNQKDGALSTRLLILLVGWIAVLVALFFAVGGREIRSFNRMHVLAILLAAIASAALLAAICVTIRLRSRLYAKTSRVRDELTRTILCKTPCRQENALSMYLMGDVRYVLFRESVSDRIYFVTEAVNDEWQITEVDRTIYDAAKVWRYEELQYAMEVPLPKEQ